MIFSHAAVFALVAAFASAAPAPESQISPLQDVLSIVDLNYEWHKPTANDLHIISANGTYDSGEDGLPLTGGIAKRQSGVYRTNSARVGDGNPHQNPYQQQQTPTNKCGDGTCGVSITRSHSLSWTASANAAYGWISGGFSVQETYTRGTGVSCQATGEDVCLWFSYGVTAYTVSSTQCYYYNGRPSMCRNLGTRILYSPNHCQPGQPYCVRGGACRKENSGYYAKDNAPAGGPPC